MSGRAPQIMNVDRRHLYYIRSAVYRANDPIEFQRRFLMGVRYLTHLHGRVSTFADGEKSLDDATYTYTVSYINKHGREFIPNSNVTSIRKGHRHG